MARAAVIVALLACIPAGCRRPAAAPEPAPEPPAAPVEDVSSAGEDMSEAAEESPAAPPGIEITSCRTDHPCAYGIEIEKPGGEPMLFTVDVDRGCKPSLSPDGERLAFMDRAGLRVVGTRTGTTDASFQIEEETTVSYDRPDPCIAWSPDGTKLALVGLNEEKYDMGKLVVLDLATGAHYGRKVKALVLCGDGCYSTAPLWSKDGLYVIVLEPRIHVPDPPLFKVFCASTGELVKGLPATIEGCDECYADMFSYGWTQGGELFFDVTVDAKIHVEVPFDPGGGECPPHTQDATP